MTEEQLKILLEYIDARIDERTSRHDIQDAITMNQIKRELEREFKLKTYTIAG